MKIARDRKEIEMNIYRISDHLDYLKIEVLLKK